MKSAVLVTDVQSKIFDSIPQPFEADKVIARINHVTGLARSARIPIIFLQHEVAGYLDYESQGWQLQNNLVAGIDDIFIRKTAGDSFLHTTLDETLKSMEIERIFICGYATEFCIDNTIRRATGLDYAVTIISDAHTTHDKNHLTAAKIREHHNVTLSMGPTITIVSSERFSIDS